MPATLRLTDTGVNAVGGEGVSGLLLGVASTDYCLAWESCWRPWIESWLNKEHAILNQFTAFSVATKSLKVEQRRKSTIRWTMKSD